MFVTAYFEFPSPAQTAEALRRIPTLRMANSAFSNIGACRSNHSANCAELDFFNPFKTEIHPLDFPYRQDVAEIVKALGAIRVTRNNIQIWPRPSTSA